MLYYVYKIKKEVEHMKNQYIPKKLKMTIILNTLYQIYSTFMTSSSVKMLEQVGKALMPSVEVTKFDKLFICYQNTEFNIMNANDDWTIYISYIVAYADTHNIKLYSREYLCF